MKGFSQGGALKKILGGNKNDLAVDYCIAQGHAV